MREAAGLRAENRVRIEIEIKLSEGRKNHAGKDFWFGVGFVKEYLLIFADRSGLLEKSARSIGFRFAPTSSENTVRTAYSAANT